MDSIDVGLEGVVVGATAISNVQGDVGQLSYRGIDIVALADQPFLKVVWLLLFGSQPSAAQEQQLGEFLRAHRDLNPGERQLLDAIPLTTHPMLMLQGMVPLLDLQVRAPLAVPCGGDDALHGLIIAARLPTLVAAWYNRCLHRAWPQPCENSQPQRAFLHALHGVPPDDAQVAVLDATQILQMEHSYNAGTFAGRIALSTLAPIQSSISASLGTLYGSLHGGADQAALEFAQAVAEPELAAAQVAKTLAGGGRIMGMGHREYRTVDPRATLLKPLARKLCANKPVSARLLATLEAIEAASVAQLEKPGKPIRANVEFYKGAVFHALDIPTNFFTAMFATARVYGYIAHALEFRPQSRLIRPRALYCPNPVGTNTSG